MILLPVLSAYGPGRRPDKHLHCLCVSPLKTVWGSPHLVGFTLSLLRNSRPMLWHGHVIAAQIMCRTLKVSLGAFTNPSFQSQGFFCFTAVLLLNNIARQSQNDTQLFNLASTNCLDSLPVFVWFHNSSFVWNKTTSGWLPGTAESSLLFGSLRRWGWQAVKGECYENQHMSAFTQTSHSQKRLRLCRVTPSVCFCFGAFLLASSSVYSNAFSFLLDSRSPCILRPERGSVHALKETRKEGSLSGEAAGHAEHKPPLPSVSYDTDVNRTLVILWFTNWLVYFLPRSFRGCSETNTWSTWSASFKHRTLCFWNHGQRSLAGLLS